MAEQSNSPRPPEMTNRLILELVYDSPVTQDTVNALVQVHEGDEGIVRVRGALLP
jgi:hypothetical protein